MTTHILKDLIHRAAPPESHQHRSNPDIGKAAYGPHLPHNLACLMSGAFALIAPASGGDHPDIG